MKKLLIYFGTIFFEGIFIFSIFSIVYGIQSRIWDEEVKHAFIAILIVFWILTTIGFVSTIKINEEQ